MLYFYNDNVNSNNKEGNICLLLLKQENKKIIIIKIEEIITSFNVCHTTNYNNKSPINVLIAVLHLKQRSKKKQNTHQFTFQNGSRHSVDIKSALIMIFMHHSLHLLK